MIVCVFVLVLTCVFVLVLTCVFVLVLTVELLSQCVNLVLQSFQDRTIVVDLAFNRWIFGSCRSHWSFLALRSRSAVDAIATFLSFLTPGSVLSSTSRLSFRSARSLGSLRSGFSCFALGSLRASSSTGIGCCFGNWWKGSCFRGGATWVLGPDQISIMS